MMNARNGPNQQLDPNQIMQQHMQQLNLNEIHRIQAGAFFNNPPPQQPGKSATTLKSMANQFLFSVPNQLMNNPPTFPFPQSPHGQHPQQQQQNQQQHHQQQQHQQQQQQQQQQHQKKQKQRSNNSCYNCGGQGHAAEQCPDEGTS